MTGNLSLGRPPGRTTGTMWTPVTGWWPDVPNGDQQPPTCFCSWAWKDGRLRIKQVHGGCRTHCTDLGAAARAAGD